MADLEARLELALDDALSGIGQVDERLGSAVTDFKTGLADALNLLTGVEVTADAAPITSAIDQAVGAADLSPAIEADAGDMTQQIDQAVGAADTTITPDVSADAITSDIDQAVQSADTTVTVDADTTDAQAALDDLGASGSKAGEGLSAAAGGGQQAGVGIGAVAPAAGLAAGELGGLNAVVGEFGPEAAAAGGAALGLVSAGKELFDAALEQQTALERLNRTFGDTAEAVQHVNVGGLNEDLDKLAIETGSNVDGLRNFAASFGQLGIDSGHAKEQVAGTVDEIIALASRASVLNPQLGSADEIVGRLSTSLARGGRFLSLFGISLTTAEINARALIDTGKQSAAELTLYEKSAAGAEIATERLGTKLGKDITNGAQSDAVQVRRLGVELDEAKKKAGAELVAPVTESMKELIPVLTDAIGLLGQGLTAALREVEPELKLVGEAANLLGSGGASSFGVFGAAAHNLLGQLNPLHAIGTVTDLIHGNFLQLGHDLPVIGVGFDIFDKGKSQAEKMADQTKKLADEQNQQAHSTLIAAVAAGQLGRADEVAAIQQHTAKDGSVDWAGVLEQLQGTIDTTASKSDAYSQAVANQAQVTKDAAQGSQDFAQAQLGTLVSTGQLTQAQLDHLAALNLTKQGTADYVAALQSIDPAAAKVAADQALIAGGLDTQATRFTLAKDEAALYGEQFDQMVGPFLNAEKAQTDFTDKVDAALSVYGNAKLAASAYKDTISEFVDPALAANEANIKLQDQIDKTNKALSDNKGIVDERTKAGRDDESAVIDLVKAYDSEVEALIASGESSKVVAGERQGEIDKLNDLKAKYPGLSQSVDEYVGHLKQASASGEEARRTTEAHRKALEDIITAGDQWIQTLIITGTNETGIASARQDEIAKLQALKAQYPELTGTIDTYIAKLQAIPASKDTLINLPNTVQNEVDLFNIHKAIDELNDKHVIITADTVQAQLALDALSVEAQRVAITVIQSLGHLRLQAGGPFDAGQVITTNEIGQEPIVFGQPGFVVSHSEAVAAVERAAGGTAEIDYDRLGQGVAKAMQGQRPVIINQVAQDPEATATAVSVRLGSDAVR